MYPYDSLAFLRKVFRQNLTRLNFLLAMQTEA